MAEGAIVQLTRVMEQLFQRLAEPRQPRINLAPPTFDRQDDVDTFIQRFDDIARANRWQPDISLLYLREALKGETRDCGRAATVDAVYRTL